MANLAPLYSRSRVCSLRCAVQRYVEPGLHLHFASTPSRSNAAIREVARQYIGTQPAFTLSTTGFHSTAHLLGLLRLGRRQIGCFFGDNHPAPRGNILYRTLEEVGVELEHWSLATYVAAFRAGARAEPYAVTGSLSGSDLGRQLSESGSYFEVPDPNGAGRTLCLVRAMRADVAFVHAAVGDEQGNALFCPPYCEGFYAALGAKRGVIVTVESVVSSEELRHYPQFLPIPSHRVLALCEAPRGAHPQPLHVVVPQYERLGYGDDPEHYALWRHMTQDSELFGQFCREVLARSDDETAYREFVAGASPEPAIGRALRSREAMGRGESLPEIAPCPPPVRTDAQSIHKEDAGPFRPNLLSLSKDERATLLGARAVVRLVIERGFTSILAGIGLPFAVARVAEMLLLEQGVEPELLVETGLAGFEPSGADPFLLGYRNILTSRRVTDVEHVLGTLVCGVGSKCVGVIGAAQVDSQGRINSSRVGGKFLVGSGGANDIASCADEVVVVTRASPERLVQNVEFITSPGSRVRSIVTECFELRRASEQSAWTIEQWLASAVDQGGPDAVPQWATLELNFGSPIAEMTAAECGALDALRRSSSRVERPSWVQEGRSVS